MNKKIFLVSMDYPYPHGEDSFIPQELKHLCQDFEVVIVPFMANLLKEPSTVDTEIKVDIGFSKIWDAPYSFIFETIPTLVDINLWISLLKHIRALKSLKILKGTVGELRTAKRFAKWFEATYESTLSTEKVTVYCWWSNWGAISAALISKKFDINLVVRAHGQDLYDFRSNLGFQPFQKTIVKEAKWYLPDSQAGVNYLIGKYPKFEHKIVLGKVGTLDYGVAGSSSQGGALQFLSVSSLHSVKRVPLLAQGLAEIISNYPEIDFFWTHIGDGPEREDLDNIVKATPRFESRVSFIGHVLNFEVINHYITKPVDLFINVSSSEGTPISLMEATSFGVPIMATNVGGNPEIVGATSGILLSAAPSSTELATRIIEFVKLPNPIRQEMRRKARTGWADSYSADSVYADLMLRIKESS